jgi:hypothetical protein
VDPSGCARHALEMHAGSCGKNASGRPRQYGGQAVELRRSCHSPRLRSGSGNAWQILGTRLETAGTTLDGRSRRPIHPDGSAPVP